MLFMEQSVEYFDPEFFGPGNMGVLVLMCFDERERAAAEVISWVYLAASRKKGLELAGSTLLWFVSESPTAMTRTALENVLSITSTFYKQQRNNEGSVLLVICAGNPPMTAGFPTQRASNVLSVSMLCLVLCSCSCLLDPRYSILMYWSGCDLYSGSLRKRIALLK